MPLKLPYLLLLFSLAQHDNTLHLLFPHHPPEVIDSVWEGPLSRYVGSLLPVTLQVTQKIGVASEGKGVGGKEVVGTTYIGTPTFLGSSFTKVGGCSPLLDLATVSVIIIINPAHFFFKTSVSYNL